MEINQMKINNKLIKMKKMLKILSIILLLLVSLPLKSQTKSINVIILLDGLIAECDHSMYFEVKDTSIINPNIMTCSYTIGQIDISKIYYDKLISFMENKNNINDSLFINFTITISRDKEWHYKENHYRCHIPAWYINKKSNSYTIIRILSRRKDKYEVRYTTSFSRDELGKGEKDQVY